MSAMTAFFVGLESGVFAGVWVAYFTRRWWMRKDVT